MLRHGNATRRLSHLVARYGVIILLLAPACGHATQFWLGGEDPVVQYDKHKSAPADYLQMFAPDAPWPRAAAHLAVFKISTQFATRAAEPDLAAVMANLRARGISLAMETGMLAADRECGRGEGYSPPGLLDRAMRRILRAGGRLDYVAMDEVVFYGREKTWADRPDHIPCQDNIDELAREVAASAAIIHSYFPLAAIGDIEPVTSRIDLSRQVNDYLAFADAFRARTGIKLAFFHADIAWETVWQPALPPLKQGFHARNIRYGAIIDGSPDDGSDDAWVRAGLQRLRRLEADQSTAPDDVVVQSWQPLPTTMLPETSPGSLTHLLLNAESIAH